MAGLEVIDARICPQCKRKFVVPLGGREDYVYKLHQKTRTDNFCSWTCYKMAKRKNSA